MKIFLWFWLATALIVGVAILVNWSTQSEPLARQSRRFFGNVVRLNSQTAAQIYENEGLDGLRSYLDRQATRRRINSIGFFDSRRNLIAGNLKIEEASELFDKAMQTNRPEFVRFPDKTFAAKKVILEGGGEYMYILELKRFQSPPFFTLRLLLPILAGIFTAGLVCYALAQYLSSPIAKLRAATRNFAEGNLETRVASEVGARRDELAGLAKDFDNMAERIGSLITSEKRLTQDISHELRSPLARMNVAIELAKAKSNSETIPLLERLETESERLNDLISQILTLSRLETGSDSFERMQINLARIVEKVVSDANFEARASNKAVNFAKPNRVTVFGNEHLLRRAIENVLRNAVRYTKADTEVDVAIENVGKNAVITIRDHGEGVPETDLEKLFSPFYRVEEARDRRSGGIGLGLAIAESAVKSHDGRINAKNIDGGLLVTITLPILDI